MPEGTISAISGLDEAVREVEEYMASKPDDPIAKRDSIETITIKFAKGLVGEPFMSKNGKELVEIRIPNSDPNDKRPWQTFVLAAKENKPEETLWGTGRPLREFLHVDDPAINLAIVAAILSSAADIAIDPKTCFAGEMGLNGEIRPVTHIDQRIAEADKLGFTRMFLSKYNLKGLNTKDLKIKLIPISKVEEIYKHLFE